MGFSDLAALVHQHHAEAIAGAVPHSTWNVLHRARMMKDAGGLPAHGNQRSEWDAGARFDFPNPEYR